MLRILLMGITWPRDLTFYSPFQTLKKDYLRTETVWHWHVKPIRANWFCHKFVILTAQTIEVMYRISLPLSSGLFALHFGAFLPSRLFVIVSFRSNLSPYIAFLRCAFVIFFNISSDFFSTIHQLPIAVTAALLPSSSIVDIVFMTSLFAILSWYCIMTIAAFHFAR